MNNQAKHYRLEQLKKRHVIYGPRFDAPACNHARFVENASRALRFVGYADQLSTRIMHTGWWPDDQGELDTIRGVVYRLPHGKFAYGYADPINEDCAMLCFDDDADNAEEAALYADEIARIAAEHERDYQRKWLAAERVRCLRELVRAARADHTALIGATWAGSGNTGERMRRDVREAARKAAKEIRETIAEHGDEILSREFN